MLYLLKSKKEHSYCRWEGSKAICQKKSKERRMCLLFSNSVVIICTFEFLACNLNHKYVGHVLCCLLHLCMCMCVCVCEARCARVKWNPVLNS
jgi:hypothetical protein